MPSKRTILLADLGLLYASAIWGVTFLIVKMALADIDAVTMVAYRFLIAGLVLLVYVLASKRELLAGMSTGLFLAIILVLLYVPQTAGLKYTTVSNSGFITGLFVAFVPIFLRTIFHRKPTLWEWIASAVALIGLWILTGGLTRVNLGDILTLVAAMAYALHLLYSDKYMKSGFDPYVISCQQFLLVGLISLIVSLVAGRPLAVGSTSTALWVLFLALFPTLSAFVIQMLAQRFTSPLKVSLIFALEPVFAAVTAWTIGGELFSMRGAIGGLFIVAALGLSGMPSKLTPDECPKE
ncbi:MAG: DMT family transporter [Candidatus Zixiibacteriota bacterium]